MFRWFRRFRSGVSMVSAVPVVSVVSFRWFRFGVSGFSTCQILRQTGIVVQHDLLVFVILIKYTKSHGFII